MAKVIDLRDLPEEQVKFVQKLVESLKEKAKLKRRKDKGAVSFAAWPLSAKGKLTRKDIYDYL